MANNLYRPRKITNYIGSPKWQHRHFMVTASDLNRGPDWGRIVLNNQNGERVDVIDMDWSGFLGQQQIPASSVINGITIAINSHINGGSDIQVNSIQLLKSGVPVGDNKGGSSLAVGVEGDYFLYDAFDGVNGTNLNGRTPTIGVGAWFVPSGNLTISNSGIFDDGIIDATPLPNFPNTNVNYDFFNEPRQPSVVAGASAPTAIIDSGTTDGILGCWVSPQGTNGNVFELYFRYTNSSNHMKVRFIIGSSLFRLIRVESGVSTIVGTYNWSSAEFPWAFGATTPSGTPAMFGISVICEEPALQDNSPGNTKNIQIYIQHPGRATFSGTSFEDHFNSSETRCGFYTNAAQTIVSQFYKRKRTLVGTWPSFSELGARQFNTNYFGNSSDLWGTTWTPADINDPEFGFRFQIQNTFSSDQTASISSITLSVDYTPVYNEKGNGGSVLGGSAEVSSFTINESDGGIVLGGESIVTAELGVVSGGVFAGGQATFVTNEFSQGGVFAGGDAVVETIFEHVVSGGAEGGGVAYEQWYIPGQGGAVLEGVAEVQNYIVPLGGITTGGSHEQTFIDYIDGTGGAQTGGSAIRADLRIKNYYPNGDIVLIGGEADAAITGANLSGKGGVGVSGDSISRMSFNLDLDFRWNTRAAITKDFEFLWNTGRLPIYWYRIIGKGRQGDECNLAADPCCQKFIVNIHARTLAELCDKLRERRLNLPIESVQRFSRPAERGVEGWDDPCNELEEVEICEIPRCAEFCVDFENSAQNSNIWGFNMFVQIDSFFDYEITDGVFIGGSANATYTRNVPNFPYESTGEITISGESDVISTNYQYTSNGSILISGEADRAHSNWIYVGGEWPTIIQRKFSTEQESLAESIGDQPWSLVEQISEDDGLYASTDISYIKNSQFLIARNFDFNIPENSFIYGLRVSIERFATQSGVKDTEVYLVVGDEIISDNLADTTNDWPVGISFSPKIYGNNGFDGSGTMWSDEPLDANDLNNPNFGIAIRVRSTLNLAAIIANVDYIAAKVFYEDAEHQRIRISGSADIVSSAFSYEASGGLIVDGNAKTRLLKVFNFVGSAGVVAGGSNTYVYNHEGSGGLISSSEAIVDPIWGEGGSTTSGTAKVTPYIEEGIGGSVIGGSSLDSWHKHYEASGSIQLSGEADTPDNTFSYEGSGGIVLDSTTIVKSSAWHWESSGNAIFVVGGADYKASDLGTFFQTGGFDMVVSNIIISFQNDQHLGDAVGVTENIRQCGCLSVPLTINFEHNFVRDNILAQFLRRNNLSLPSILHLDFNRINSSWQTNQHFKGFSADSNTRETWDIVFELQCTSLIGSLEIGRNIWKLSVQFFRRNLNTGEDFDTRIIVGVLPEPICQTNANELKFTVTYDTQSDAALISPNATIYQSSIFDNIGLFKKPSWIQNPELVLTISQAGLNVPQTTIDVVSDVLFPDDRPVGYINEGSSIRGTKRQLQNQN